MLTPHQQKRHESHVEFFEGVERETGASSMSKKIATYLYSAAHVGGYLHDITAEERDELLASGEWFDTPAGLVSVITDAGSGDKSVGVSVASVCPHCGKPLFEPVQGDSAGTAESALLTRFKDGKKLTKQELSALGQELGIVLVADDLTAKQMAEEIEGVLNTPPLS